MSDLGPLTPRLGGSTRLSRLSARLRKRVRAVVGLRAAPPASPEWVRLESFAAYCRFREVSASEIDRRRALERGMATGGQPFTVTGYCWGCRDRAELEVNYGYASLVDGVVAPNWRERLICTACGLNNRMRATVHFVEERLATPSTDAAIYLTEQTTPLFRRISARHKNVVGSEYLGRVIGFGERTAGGIRNESVTGLTFASGSFDLVVSLDVLEHVADFRRGLAEIHRVLRPGGNLLLSVPFFSEREENLVRAIVDDRGEVHHILPPEYHGDPLRPGGCLAFYKFGWELLDQVRGAGFAEVNAYSFWSRGFGYLGSDLILFVATRQARS